MAGNPKRRKAFASLDELGIAMVMALVAAGWTVKQLCEAEGISEYLFYQWIGKRGHKPKLAEARRLRAERLADEALEIADGVEPRRGAVAKAKLQIDHRRWLAARLSPEQFGPPRGEGGSNIRLTIGELHLSALKKVNAEQKALREAAEPQILEAEVVAEEEVG